MLEAMRLLLLAWLALWLCSCQQQPPPPPSETPAASPAAVITPTPEVTETPAETPSPIAAPSPGRIKAAILTRGEDDITHTTTFSPDTDEIAVVFTPERLPEGTEVTARWRLPGKEPVTVEKSDRLEADTRRDERVLEKPEGGWPEGEYTVELLIGEEKVQELAFRVGDPKKQPVPDVDAVLTDDLQSRKPKVTFSTARTPEILLIVSTYKLPKGTPVKSVWTAREVEKLEENELVASTTVLAPGPDEDALFLYAPPRGGFHPGAYQVDLYVDEQRVLSKNFWIKAGSGAED